MFGPPQQRLAGAVFHLPQEPVCSVSRSVSGLVLKHSLFLLKSSTFHVAVEPERKTRLNGTLRVASASYVTEEQGGHVTPRPKSPPRPTT